MLGCKNKTKYFLSQILCAIIVLLNSGSLYCAEDNLDDTREQVTSHYHLKIKSKGYTYIISVNGVEVTRKDGANTIAASLVGLDYYLKHGKNSFEIDYQRSDRPLAVLEIAFKQRMFMLKSDKNIGTKQLFSFTASIDDTPLNVLQQKQFFVPLNLRGKGTYSYILNASARKCEIEINLNDTWTNILKDTPSSSILPLNALQEGENTLTVRTQEAVSDEPAEWKVTIMQRWKDGSWEPKIHLTAKETTTGSVRTKEFSITELPQLTPLAKQPVNELSSEDRKSILTFVHRLHSAYKTKNIQEIFALEKRSFLNIWERYGMSEKEQGKLLERFPEKLKEDSKQPWKVYPLPSDLKIGLRDGLVVISASEPIIEVRIEKGSTIRRYTLYLAKDENKWQLAKFDFSN